MTAADGTVRQERVADRQTGDAVAQLLDPSGVLVSERVARCELLAHGLVELLEDGDVGVAGARACDLEEDFTRPRCRTRDILDGRERLPGGEADGFHSGLLRSAASV